LRLLLYWLALSVSLFGANPYLAQIEDTPITREFLGFEWGDDVILPKGKERAPFRAQVTTQRVAVMNWGAIYKISFEPTSQRRIEPYHFLATDREILLLSSEDLEREIRVIREMKQPPKFEPRDVWGLSRGKLKTEEGPWVTTIVVQGNRCQREAIHENSGHFGRVVWQRGSGLVEFSMGRGAMADGFELKWTPKK
jgi:GAF domain-containing protein